MALTYTTEQMIASVLLRARIPNTQADGTADDDIVRWLNEQLWLEVAPWLVGIREDYFVLTEQIPAVPNQSHYRIPVRAYGNKLREVKWRGSGDNPEDDVDLSYITRENLNRYNRFYQTSEPIGFFFENVDLVLVPERFGSDGSLILSYFFRPGDLVKTDRYAVITNIVGNVVTVDSAPAAFTTSLKYDIHSPESGAEVKTWDIVPSLIAANDFTFALADINGSKFGRKAIAVGDYLVEQKTAAIPAIPRDLHPLLAQSAAAAILHATGFVEEAREAERRLKEMYAVALDAFKERVEGEPESVVNLDSPWWGDISYNRNVYG